MRERTLLPVASSGQSARLASRLLLRHPGALALTVVSFAMVGLAGVIAPRALGDLVDIVRDNGDAADLRAPLLTIVAAAVAGAVAAAVSSAALAQAAIPALAELREEVLDRALHLDAARLEEAGTGDLMARVGDDVRTVTASLDEAVPLLLNSLMAILFTIGGLFALDLRLGISGLLTLPLYVHALAWYLPRSAPRYRRERVAQGERAEQLVSGMQGAQTLRAYGHEALALDRIARSSSSAKTIAVDVYVLLTRFFARMNLAEAVGMLLVLVAGFALVRAEDVTVGAATAAMLYFHRLFNPIGSLLMIFDNIQSAGASMTRLAGVALLPAPAPATGAMIGAPLLELTDVSHSYVPEQPVLRNVNLRVEPGRQVALVGATGAGKTTAAAIAAGLIRPSHGHVELGGIDLSTVPAAEVRRHIAVVSQEVHVFAGTVRDNLTLARTDALDSEVLQALEDVGARDWVTALSAGLDTTVGPFGRALTSAQAQHLALARVLLHDPQVVVLDEATAEAGSAGARVLEAAARAVTAGRTSLVVAHRLTQARQADQVVVLDAGEIVEQGTHEELVAAGGRYATLWRAWAQR